MLIDKGKYRERLLKAIADYNRHRRKFIGHEPKQKNPKRNPSLFDRIRKKGVENEHGEKRIQTGAKMQGNT